MKRIIALCILSLCATSICSGQTNQTESLTIATYYPSPSGAYASLRLSPTNTAPGGATPGMIFYNNTTNTLQFYNKTNVWVNLTGGSGTAGYWTYNSSTQSINNTNVTSNGTVVINGNSADPDILRIYGDMRVKGQANDDALFYIVRKNVTKSSTLRFFTNENPYEDQFNLSLTGSPGYFKIGNKTRDFMLVERNTGKITIGAAMDPAATITKLHIIGDMTINAPDHTSLRLEGDGEIALGLKSTYAHGGYIYTHRSRGTYASPSVVRVNDSLVFITGYGYNGTGHNPAASIQFAADLNFTSTVIASRMSFNTTPAGSITPVERLVSKYNGRIGIGESNPQYPLQVRINSTVEGHMNSTDGKWWQTSDRRHKKNISGIEGALEKVLRVNGVRYDALTDEPSTAQKGRYFGFIGQDLETVMPELVETDAKGYKCVSYSGVAPVLVEAIQDQQKDIESLRNEIEALKARK